MVALNYNDYEDNLRYPLYRIEDDALSPLEATDSPLYRVARLSESLPALLAERRVTRAALRLFAQLAAQPRPPAASESELFALEQRKLVLQLERLAALAKSDGFSLLVLGLPYRDGDWDPFSWIEAPMRGRAPLLDLSRDASWQQQKERWFFRTDEHLSPAGHERVARELYEFLEARGWIARAARVGQLGGTRFVGKLPSR